MIVKELFDKIDFETLWNCFYNDLMKDEEDTPDKVKEIKACHKYAYNKIKTLKPEVSDNHILIFYKAIETLDENEPPREYDDVSLFYKDEIKEKFKKYEKFEENYDFSNLTKNELIECLHESRNDITSYAFEFSPWKEILGYEVNLNSIEDIGEVKCLASVFYEMTFCGFEEEDIQEEMNEIIERRDEVEEAIETGDTSKFVPISEIFPDWDKYTPSEENMRLSYLYSVENWKRIYKYLKNI